jgi:hypothetical protein
MVTLDPLDRPVTPEQINLLVSAKNPDPLTLPDFISWLQNLCFMARVPDSHVDKMEGSKKDTQGLLLTEQPKLTGHTQFTRDKMTGGQ